MDASKFDKGYWEKRWQAGETGWDIGAASLPLKEYFDQLEDKQRKILIPGCGNAWEGEFLHRQGFTNVHLVDLAPSALENFIRRVPGFPGEHLIPGDFFQLEDAYDLIIEQTFFCSIEPRQRRQYALKAWNLLRPGGKLVGLLFDDDFGKEHPPFGGRKSEYLEYFKPWFHIKYFDTAYNSIKPRAGREIFMNLVKR